MGKPASKKRSAKTDEDDFVVPDDGEPSTKRNKGAKDSTVGKRGKDEEGNWYWELGGKMRRVTLSKFKGNTLVNIREHYEKDGKVLPGKKGISLSIDQFNAMLSVLPEIEVALHKSGIEMVQPELADEGEVSKWMKGGHPDWVKGDDEESPPRKKAVKKQEKKVKDEEEDDNQDEE